MGFKVALHSAGIYPTRFAAVLPMLEWVGFDIKTAAAGHDALTSRVRSHQLARKSLGSFKRPRFL
jgi:pyruvate formate lyase activating enzyme